MSDWIFDHMDWIITFVLVAVFGCLIGGVVHDENVRQAMIGKTKDAIIQVWGPPSIVTSIQGAEVDTWAQFHDTSTTYVYQSAGKGGGVAIPITTPAYTERTVVTFVNGVATRVEHQ